MSAATLTEAKDSAAVSLILAVIAFPLLALRAFVMARLWLWFLVPIGLPLVTTTGFIGANLIWQLFKGNVPTDLPSNEKMFSAQLAYALTSLCVWLFGWLLAGQP